MKFSEMPYKRVDLDEFKQQAGKIIEEFKSAQNVGEAVKSFYDMQKFKEDAYTMLSLASTRNSINIEDEFYDGEKKYYNEVSPYMSEYGDKFSRELVGSKFRAELESRFGSLMFENIELGLKTFSPEIIPDLQEENRLSSRYDEVMASAQIEFDGKILNRSQLGAYKLDNDRDVRRRAYIADAGFLNGKKAELDDIFDKLVKLRTKMAKTLGFENFIELGYCRMTRNNYNQHDVANFREQVKNVLVPVVSALKEQQKKRLDISDFKMYDNDVLFKDGNAAPFGTPEQIMQAGREMYEELSPETSEFINFMLDNELFDVIAKKGKKGGGYCTSFATYKAPFIFSNFNGTSDDIDVLTHEAGHAFACYKAFDIEIAAYRGPTAESCEIHSMAMEFFTWDWMHKFFADKTDKYKYAHLAKALAFITYGTIVDLYQHIIYENPDLTPEQRCAEWGKLEKTFRPWIDTGGMPYFEEHRRWQVQAHIYGIPFYYIDYCLAQVTALSFWALMRRGDPADSFKDAWARYMRIIEFAGTKKFTELVKSADFPVPFEAGALDTIADTVMRWLETASMT